MMRGCCLAAGGLHCAKQVIMPLICNAAAVCRHTDGWCEVKVALVLIKRFTGAVKAACSPKLAPFPVRRRRRLAYICIAMLNRCQALQLLLLHQQ